MGLYRELQARIEQTAHASGLSREQARGVADNVLVSVARDFGGTPNWLPRWKPERDRSGDPAIAAAYHAGASAQDLAKKHNVHATTIYRIAARNPQT